MKCLGMHVHTSGKGGVMFLDETALEANERKSHHRLHTWTQRTHLDAKAGFSYKPPAQMLSPLSVSGLS